LGVDAAGKPTTKMLGWADTRSREQVAKLRKKFYEAKVHNRTGARFHPSFWPAKLSWLRHDRRKDFEKTACWLSFSDFVSLRLCGTGSTSVSMASATGLFDIRRCEWDDELLRFLKLKRGSLPKIVPDHEQPCNLILKYRKLWPPLKNALWFPAIGDGAANNIGAGCVTGSKAALMIGTSGAMRVAYRGPVPTQIPSGLWCYRVDRERVIMGGALSDGGGLYRWLKDNLRLEMSDDELENEIAKRPPAAHGLTFLPFLAGERGTGYHESAAGGMIGLNTATDAVDIVQAALESVAYRFEEIFEQLNSVCEIDEMIASGGALRESPVWTQMIADVLGRELTLPDTHEASSRGAVLLALESIGNIDAIEITRTPKGRKFTPNRKRHALYRVAFKRHRKIYQTNI
jgi:gluconokinase